MSATDWKIISERELDGAEPSGGFIRSYCHIHGGDHQRSLSINEETGFGQCHQCGEKVLVREWNPEAAERIERGLEAIAAGEIKVRDPKYIKVEPRPPKPPRLKDWQKEEVRILREIQAGMERCIDDERAKAYLAQRGTSLLIAKAHHIGYIPATLPAKYKGIEKWCDHIVFPVYHPEHGLQFAARCLKFWTPGMDENEHKALLREKGVDRYRKTHASGWFNFQALEAATCITLVEGVWDALALIEASLRDIVAVVGYSLNVSWLPKSLQHVTLAFDGDEQGIDKAQKARDKLYIKGYEVTISSPPADDMGKDWSERYRRYGRKGLEPLLSLLAPYYLSVCQECGADPGLSPRQMQPIASSAGARWGMNLRQVRAVVHAGTLPTKPTMRAYPTVNSTGMR